MKGLAPHTLQVFEAVSKLDCIKPYLLVGGTALSLQMGTRQNEDLDFLLDEYPDSLHERGTYAIA